MVSLSNNKPNHDPRRILIAHNHYQLPGGEDYVYQAEGDLLEAHGHEVIRYAVHNKSVDNCDTLRLACRTIWNDGSTRELVRMVRLHRPDVVHFHNTLPVISPGAYHAVRSEGVAVVQTLHNYRLLCPSATLYRDGSVCEQCCNRSIAWPGVAHGCYRGSRLATAAVAMMLSVHRALGTWGGAIDAYIALTDFAKAKFSHHGLPSDKIHVKPNFVWRSKTIDQATHESSPYIVYVGRLTEEKGIGTMLKSMEWMSGDIKLLVFGDGPLRDQVVNASKTNSSIVWLGHQPTEKVRQTLRNALCLVFPSQWYEGFGLSIIEAFAEGVPVVASNMGAMSTLVEHERTGLFFKPGDPTDMALQIWHLLSNPRQRAKMGNNCQHVYEQKFSADRNYDQLIHIYKNAMAVHSSDVAVPLSLPVLNSN